MSVESPTHISEFSSIFKSGVWDFRPLGIDVQAAVTSKEGLDMARKKLSELDGIRPIREIDFADKICLLSASDDFEIFEKPHESWSKNHGSEAYYILRSKDGRILIQAMLPYRRSSKHDHDGSEEYHQLGGRLVVLTEQETQEVSSRKLHTVLPQEVYHQVFTLQEPSFSLIICNFTLHRYK